MDSTATFSLRKLSHSSRLSLHECPRKFQLYRLSASGADNSADEEATFDFGHLVGEGIQLALEEKSYQQVVFTLFSKWKSDLFFEDAKRKKSFFYGMTAIKKFFALRAAGFLRDYELAYTEKGEPAIELGFCVQLPGDFEYRGFVDVVLRHKTTGEVLVLEIKTSSWNVVAEAFKNSGQAIGYSVVLDHLFPGLSAYKVLYLVYKTVDQEFEPVEYRKTLFQRALWLNELLLDCKMIELYQEHDVFPMHGENCINKFGKQCKYFGICTMRTESIVPRVQPFKDTKKYHYTIGFEDLLNTQLQNAPTQAPDFVGHIDTEEDEVL